MARSVLFYFFFSVLFLTGCPTKTTSDSCGDGILDINEECEPSDLNGHYCQEYGFYAGAPTCTSECTISTATCSLFCGDGRVDSVHNEECDGDNFQGATCDSIEGYSFHPGGTLLCTAECTIDVSGCTECGDGVLQNEHEVCDGDDLGGTTCEDLGYYGGALACEEGCGGFDTSDCALYGMCGDGVVQETSETCDGTSMGTGPALCREVGYWGGALDCLETCDGLDVSSCYGVEQVALTSSHACLVDQMDRAFCWGERDSGALGYTSTNPPAGVVFELTPVISDLTGGLTQISTGVQFSCGLDSLKDAWCWGADTVGQLGTGTAGTSYYSPAPVQMPPVGEFDQLCSGDNFSCGVGSDGVVYCWGENSHGSVGDGTIDNRSAPVSVVMPPEVTAFTQISCGGQHACALSHAGIAYCWGNNASGQLGIGLSGQENQPVALALPLGATSYSMLSAGGSHTCAVDNTGALWCWGKNTDGELGTGSTLVDPVLDATSVNTLSGLSFSHVHANYDSTCAISQGGIGWCWGSNIYGRLGTGLEPSETDHSATPLELFTLPTGYGRFYGRSGTVCATSGGGQLYCWGGNNKGLLGVDSSVSFSATPVAILEP